MQLFILDYSPENAAEMLCDAHLRKMCLETSQILSSVIRNRGGNPLPPLPLPYNPHHPVIKAVDTPAKINWLLRYNRALHKEFRRRFQKTHRYAGLIRLYHRELFPGNVKITPDMLDFSRTFKDETILLPDLVDAYREYYRRKKRLLRHWHYTGRTEPEWLK